MTATKSGIAKNGDLEIYFDAFGDPSKPALLLVSGLGSQCITYLDELCERFVEAGFYTIRYDNRDVGLSTKFSHVEPDFGAVITALQEGREPDVPYRLSEMATDGMAVLDHLGIEKAHVAGMSMGGMLVQTMAIEHPERLLSVTSIMSTTGDRNVGRATRQANELLLKPAGTTKQDAIERAIEGAQAWGSPEHFDADRIAEITGRSYDRAFFPDGVARQLMAINSSPDRTEALAATTTPMLVLHGDQDNLIDQSGGLRTAEVTPGAKLVILEGMGHDLPMAYWDRIVTLISDHAREAVRS